MREGYIMHKMVGMAGGLWFNFALCIWVLGVRLGWIWVWVEVGVGVGIYL